MLATATLLTYLTLILVKYSHSTVKRNNLVLFALISLYGLLKLGYLLVIPPEVISLYPDAYNVYAVARSLNTGHLLSPEKYPLAAKGLSLTPSTPLFLYIFGVITNFRLESSIKYYTLICAPLLLVSYFTVLRKIKIVNSKNLAYLGAVIGIFNYWLLGFLTWGHYANFSIAFINILLWSTLSLVESDHYKLKSLLMTYIIVVLALAFTHTYMTVVYLITILIYIVGKAIVFKSTNYMQYLLAFIACIAVLIHILYYAPQIMNVLVLYAHYTVEAIVLGSPTIALEVYGTPQASYAPITFIKYIGAVSLTTLTLASLIWYVLRFKSELEKYLLFLSMLLAGFLLHIPYYFKPLYATDVFNRVAYFVSVGGSPFIITFLFKIFEERSKRTTTLVQYAMTGALLFILMFYLLHAVNPDVVDWNTPIVAGEDSRLPRTEWLHLSLYISPKVTYHSEVYGVRIGLHYIGYLSWRDYKQLSPSPSNLNPLIPPETFTEITSRLKGALVFLRLSIVQYPDSRYFISYEDFIYTINQSHLIYCASDVIVILP